MSAGDPIGAFYERFPYPPPAGGKADGPSWGTPGNLPEVIHHVFGGALPQGRPLRILVAGGGTGNAVVSIGVWLKALGVDGRIDYLDLSTASMAIARRRAAAAGIDDVEFRIAPLESLGDGPAGVYDYVDLCGVLNHVPDAAAALAALSHATAPGGGIGVMAYGRLGRTGVYEAQAALRLLGVDGTRPDAVGLARAFVKGLPKGNWLKTNASFAGLGSSSDIELADVLLNPRDRAFGTDELDELTSRAGLTIRCFCPPYIYEPAAALRDPALKAAAAGLDRRARWRLAELLQGTFRKLVFYAVKPAPGQAVDPDDDPAQRLLADPDTVLVPAGLDLAAIAASAAGAEDGLVSLKFSVEGVDAPIATRFSALDRAIMAAFDGPTRVGRILERIAGQTDDPAAAIRSLQGRLTTFRMLYVNAGLPASARAP